MPKQLIVLCDGTTNSPESNRGKETNVQILRDLLGMGLVGERKADANHKRGWEIDQFSLHKISRHIYYDRGLGAPKLDKNGKLLRWSWSPARIFKNASFVNSKFRETDEAISAQGIIDNVAQAYHFLVQHYEPGDKIFMFGFSRGAYTLRLLETMIRYIGLVDKNKYPPNQNLEDVIENGFGMYDMNLHPNHNREVIEFRKKCHSHEGIIHFLGLWDTVRGMVKEKVHSDSKISSAVNISRHALSIDEQREIFKPEVWVAKPESDSQQLWFAGTHSDIGGGYRERGLANIALQWMLDEANKYGLELDPSLYKRAMFAPDYLAIQNDSLNARIQDSIDISWSNIGGIYRRPVAQMTSSESLHETVIARYGQLVKKDEVVTRYQPSNLTHTLVAYKNSLKNYDTPLIQELANLRIADPDTLSDVGEETSLIRLAKATLSWSN